MLHIVNKSPFEKNSFSSCIDHAKEGSAVLLIEDGVFAALKGTRFSDGLSKAKVYALKSDVDTRGIQENVDGSVELIDYSKFVDLVTENDRVQSWL